MRDRIEKLVILPFSLGCVSQSSIAVSQNNSAKKSKPEPYPFSSASRAQEEDKSIYGVNLGVPKPNITPSLHKLMKNFKNLPQLFVYKEEMLEDEMEMEMEIGLPTNVKHVAQIGWDGSGNGSKATTTIMKGCSWDKNNNLLINNPHELFSLPSISLREHFN